MESAWHFHAKKGPIDPIRCHHAVVAWWIGSYHPHPSSNVLLSWKSGPPPSLFGEETQRHSSCTHRSFTLAHPFHPGRPDGAIGSATRLKGKVSFQRPPIERRTDTRTGGPSVDAEAESRRTTKATMTEVVLRVAMSCQGCAGSVRRVLGKVEGACDPTRGKDEERKEDEVRHVS